MMHDGVTYFLFTKCQYTGCPKKNHTLGDHLNKNILLNLVLHLRYVGAFSEQVDVSNIKIR